MLGSSFIDFLGGNSRYNYSLLSQNDRNWLQNATGHLKDRNFSDRLSAIQRTLQQNPSVPLLTRIMNAIRSFFLGADYISAASVRDKLGKFNVAMQPKEEIPSVRALRSIKTLLQGNDVEGLRAAVREYNATSIAEHIFPLEREIEELIAHPQKNRREIIDRVIDSIIDEENRRNLETRPERAYLLVEINQILREAIQSRYPEFRDMKLTVCDNKALRHNPILKKYLLTLDRHELKAIARQIFPPKEHGKIDFEIKNLQTHRALSGKFIEDIVVELRKPDRPTPDLMPKSIGDCKEQVTRSLIQMLATRFLEPLPPSGTVEQKAALDELKWLDQMRDKKHFEYVELVQKRTQAGRFLNTLRNAIEQGAVLPTANEFPNKSLILEFLKVKEGAQYTAPQAIEELNRLIEKLDSTIHMNSTEVLDFDDIYISSDLSPEELHKEAQFIGAMRTALATTLEQTVAWSLEQLGDDPQGYEKIYKKYRIDGTQLLTLHDHCLALGEIKKKLGRMQSVVQIFPMDEVEPIEQHLQDRIVEDVSELKVEPEKVVDPVLEAEWLRLKLKFSQLANQSDQKTNIRTILDADKLCQFFERHQISYEGLNVGQAIDLLNGFITERQTTDPIQVGNAISKRLKRATLKQQPLSASDLGLYPIAEGEGEF